VLIADEDELDVAIDDAISSMTDAAVLAALNGDLVLPVELRLVEPIVVEPNPIIEAAIETAIDEALAQAVEELDVVPLAHPRGIFPVAYSAPAWQGEAA
jgi:hypothetical protein